MIARALNLTGRKIDVCAAFQRASSQVTWPSSLSGANAFALRVELTQLDRAGSGPLVCKVTITTATQNGTQSQASGGGSVAWNASGGNRFAGRDCVDAVVENLLVTKVVPALLVASSTPAPAVPAPAPAASAPAGSSTPPSGSPSASGNHEDSAR